MASGSATPSFQAVDATISTPQQLADALRRSGGFDSLRRSLINDFMTSPDKDLLLSRLDEILPPALSKPSFKSKAKKDRHVDLMREVETRHTMLQKSVQEVERGVRAREREREGRGKKGFIGGELERTLRRSRGELVEEEEEEELPEPVKAERPPPPPPVATPATANPLPPHASAEPLAIPTPPPPATHLHPSPPPLANPAPSPSPNPSTSTDPALSLPLLTDSTDSESKPSEVDIKMEDSAPTIPQDEPVSIKEPEPLPSEIPSAVEPSAPIPSPEPPSSLDAAAPAIVDPDVKMEEAIPTDEPAPIVVEVAFAEEVSSLVEASATDEGARVGSAEPVVKAEEDVEMLPA